MNKSDKGKMETIDAQKIKELIRAEGIDLVGVADAQESDAGASTPTGHSAYAVGPECNRHGRGAFVGCSIFARYHALDA